MARPPFCVHGLGEVAIRCTDIDAMFEFYRDIAGLEVLADMRNEGTVFFKISEGYGLHVNILALFLPDAGRPELHPHSSEAPVTGARSSLHHLALTVEYSEQEAIMMWLEQNGLEYTVQVFDWIGWRGIFTKDPEGNTIEFVAGMPPEHQKFA